MVEDSPNVSIGQVLRHQLAVRKLSGRRAANMAGLSHQVVYNILEDKVPGYKTLRQLADGIKLTPRERDALFGSANYLIEPHEKETPSDPRMFTLWDEAKNLKPEHLDTLILVARGFGRGVMQAAA